MAFLFLSFCTPYFTLSRLPIVEIKEHTIYVGHLLIDRYGDEVTGFAVADVCDDYDNIRGKRTPLIYYAGIMVNPAYRGGRAAVLTALMIMKICDGLGFFSVTTARCPILLRTQDMRIFSRAARYFHAKHNSTQFSAEDWRAVNYLAELKGWTYEPGTNICRKVYSQRMANNPNYLLPGLADQDAKVCVGYITPITPITLWLDTKSVMINRWAKKHNFKLPRLPSPQKKVLK